MYDLRQRVKRFWADEGRVLLQPYVHIGLRFAAFSLCGLRRLNTHRSHDCPLCAIVGIHHVDRLARVPVFFSMVEVRPDLWYVRRVYTIRDAPHEVAVRQVIRVREGVPVLRADEGAYTAGRVRRPAMVVRTLCEHFRQSERK